MADIPYFAVIGNEIKFARFMVISKNEEGEETVEHLYTDVINEATEYAEGIGGELTSIPTEDLAPYLWAESVELPDGADPYEFIASGFPQLQAAKQAQNNAALAEYLKTHPLRWEDGELYGITQEDQNEISLNIMQYQLKAQVGLTPKLEWHAVQKECREFAIEELMGLTNAISEVVVPLVRFNQTLKTQIFAATNISELEAIKIEYKD